MASLLSSYNVREWSDGDENGWEVRYTYTNENNPLKSVDTYIRIPTPEQFLNKELLLAPKLNEMIALRERLEIEIAENLAYREMSQEDRRLLTLSVLGIR